MCDLIIATSGIEQDIVDDAESIELFAGRHVPTASVECLLTMKVLSVTSSRPWDLGDIQAIVRTNPRFDESQRIELLETIEMRGYSRGQDLPTKWRNLGSELLPG